MAKSMQQLVLNKGSNKYIFRYSAGCEDQLLDALIDHANDPRLDFAWFDAAVLSFKLTQRLMGEADKLLHRNNTELIRQSKEKE